MDIVVGIFGGVVLSLAALLLPAMITGDWYHDRVERIMRGE